MGLFYQIRERIKLSIWDSIDIVQRVFRVLSICVSLLTMGVIVYYYGFTQTEKTSLFCSIVIFCSLLFYVVKYVAMTLFNTHSRRYILQHKLEGLMIVLIVLWMILSFLMGYLPWNYPQNQSLNEMVMIAIQVYFFTIMLTEFTYIDSSLKKIKLGPGGLLIGSFLVLISVGTALLLMPEMTRNGISLIDACFTATSASCVTGLSTLSLANDFTFKGQFVILLLIQLGGINIVCFATFFTSFYRGGSLKYQSVIKEMLSTNLQNSRLLTKEIILYTFVIELIGFLLIFFYCNFYAIPDRNLSHCVFFSIFHSISSFNNAGFCLVDGEMQNSILTYSRYLQVITLLLVFLGGIGFLTIHDLVTVHKHTGGRNYWQRLQITTKVVLKLSAFLILFGSLAFFVLEYNNVSAGANFADRIYAAMFTSISGRTAGYSIVDISSLNTATLLVMLILMTIGASAGSTSGGIKLTTFYILVKSAWATIQNKKQVTISNRAISFELVDKSYMVLFFTLAIFLSGSLVVSISDPQFSFMEILFEVVSSCSTVGLSMGITPYLSTVGKFTLIIIMYLGRITVLTFAISVARRAFNKYSLAKTNLNI